MENTRQPGRSNASEAVGQSLAAPAPARERHPGLRPVGIATSRLAAPIVAKRGGGILHRLKADWTMIVGSQLAASTWPEALSAAGALKLRVIPAYALELQHRAPLVVERINGFFGRGVVARIALMQGPLPLAAPPRAAPASAIPAEHAAALDRQVAAVGDPELRAALSALGRAVLAARSDNC
ncbi:MAG TPA: DciA family protein [Stellaceae bacterium]|nr:DciA family protein [Stellaceae bacterium]